MTLARSDIDRIAWDKTSGLVPAIVQDADSGAVLMQAWMNREALEETLRRCRVVFWSRSRGRLWEKGETSSHSLELVDIRLDCDADTLLVTAKPAGPACHLGTRTCFGDAPVTAAESIAFLGELERVIDARIAAGAETSYTAKLHARGVRHVAQKVGEEGVEVALAGVGEPDERLLAESADLVFHLLVLLRTRQLTLAQLVEELRGRHAARTPPV